MRSKSQHSFRQSIQNAIFYNALLPMLILTVSGIVLTMVMLYGSTMVRVKKYSNEAVELTNNLYTCYTEKLNQLSRREDFRQELSDRHISAALYQELYDFVNDAPVKAAFYLTDENYQFLGGSTTYCPSYLTEEGIQTGLIWRRIRSNQGEVAIAGDNSKEKKSLLFAVGVGEAENPSGYVVFEVQWQTFYQKFSGIINLVMADEYHYCFWNNSMLLLDSYHRIEKKMRLRQGIAEHSGQQLFVICKSAFHEKVLIYTYADTTGYLSIYRILIPILVLIFVGMLVLLSVAAHRVADRTGETVDRIARTMEHTEYETLDEPLCINTGDELEKIADAYNRMCRDIHHLIDDNAERAKRQAVSEIRQLEAQFNPHFLFNTLETIRVFIKTDPDKAREAIVALSGILRYSIDNTMTSVRLQEEISYAECYLQIQKTRLQDRLEYKLSVEPEAGECIVPKLILQPLVENAVLYGKSSDGSCTVNVECQIMDGKLWIEVSDLGDPLADERITAIRKLLEQPYNITSHIGLYNVHKRIRLAYGEAYGVTCGRSTSVDGNTFTVILPVKTEEDGNV